MYLFICGRFGHVHFISGCSGHLMFYTRTLADGFTKFCPQCSQCVQCDRWVTGCPVCECSRISVQTSDGLSQQFNQAGG